MMNLLKLLFRDRPPNEQENDGSRRRVRRIEDIKRFGGAYNRDSTHAGTPVYFKNTHVYFKNKRAIKRQGGAYWN